MTAALLAFIGVDGGATRCRARLRDASGRTLAEAAGEAANIHVDFAAAITVMRAVIDAAMRKAGLSGADYARIALGLGLAGINDRDDAVRVEAAFPDFGRVVAANDATTACIGAHDGADGGLIIAGTGSAAIARVRGRETIVGGRGFALGDDGSGARIGYAALRAAMRAADGLGPSGALTDAILEYFGGDPVAMVRWAKTAKPGDFGAFAPRVFDCAKAGDATARAILADAAAAVAALALRAQELGAEQLALVGGVGEPLRAYLDPGVAEKLRRPRRDAADGAILLVGGRLDAEEAKP